MISMERLIQFSFVFVVTVYVVRWVVINMHHFITVYCLTRFLLVLLWFVLGMFIHWIFFFSNFLLLLCLFKLWSICEVNISLDFSINIDLLMKPTVIVSHSYLCLIQCLAQVFGWKLSTAKTNEWERERKR